MELLEDIKDPESRIKIMEKLKNQSSFNSQDIIKDKTNPRPYLVNEVYKRIKQRTEVENTTHDLTIEINNLTTEIQRIKEKSIYLEQRISKMEKGKEVMTSYYTYEEIPSDKNFKINESHFLSTLEKFIAQKWLVNITLFISNDYSNEFVALIDSGADLNVIQEGLIPEEYFHKTTHTLSHAGGNNLQINYKLPEAKVYIDKNYIQTSFLLAKDITNQVILGTPFLTKIYPLINVDEKGIIGTFNRRKIYLKFITEPLMEVLNDFYDDITVKENQSYFMKHELNVLTFKHYKSTGSKMKGNNSRLEEATILPLIEAEEDVAKNQKSWPNLVIRPWLI
ncbi:hypothetical protein QQ045_009299 [Rhodiola kirilowii]